MFVFSWFRRLGTWQLLVVMVVAAAPTLAVAVQPSELLEKAVYADETAGNLDEAIELYGKVIAEAKAASGIAAEAQYRLGLCFEKQGETQKARQAFQAVVDDYPRETNFVALAKKKLPGALELLPIPWKDGQQLHMAMTLPTGMEIGNQIYSIEAAEHEGRPVWRCSSRGLVTISSANSFSEVLCDAESFAPLTSYWKHSMIGEANATYTLGKATIRLTGRDAPVSLDHAEPAFDNEQGVQVFRRLPLEVGMNTTLTIVTTLGSNVLKLGLEVPKKETIKTAAGEFDCFRMELNVGQTFWISDDADRYLVRFAAGGVVADLVRVEQRKQDESLGVDDEQYALTLPAGWFVYEPKNDADDKRVVHLLDRRAVATSTMLLEARESLDEGEQTSPKAWLESGLEETGQVLEGFQVREEGIVDVELGDGVEAAAVVYDFKQSKKEMTGYGVAMYAGPTAVRFRLTAPADQFEESRAELDQVMRSLQLK